MSRNFGPRPPTSPAKTLRRNGAHRLARNKLATNRTRDRLVTRTLRTRGWRVLRIWQHELTRKNEPRLLRRLHRTLGLPASSVSSH